MKKYNIVELKDDDTRQDEISDATYSVTRAKAKVEAAHKALFETAMETGADNALTNEQSRALFGVSYILEDVREDLQSALNLL